jgi:hypothetical protein
MEAKLTFKYDREADILHIDKCPPYAEQESEELPDEVIARLNPDTGNGALRTAGHRRSAADRHRRRLTRACTGSPEGNRPQDLGRGYGGTVCSPTRLPGFDLVYVGYMIIVGCFFVSSMASSWQGIVRSTEHSGEVAGDRLALFFD